MGAKYGTIDGDDATNVLTAYTTSTALRVTYPNNWWTTSIANTIPERHAKLP